MSSTAVQAFIAEGIAPVSFPAALGLADPQQVWQVPSTLAARIETVYIEADFGGSEATGQTLVLSLRAQDGKNVWAYPAPQYNDNGSPTNVIYTWFRGATDTVQLPGWLTAMDDVSNEPGITGPPLPDFYLPPLSSIAVALYSIGTQIACTLANMAVVYTPLGASDSGVTVVSAGIPLLTPTDG